MHLTQRSCLLNKHEKTTAYVTDVSVEEQGIHFPKGSLFQGVLQ